MKKIISFLAIFFVLVSCTKEDKLDSGKFPQKWKLIKMFGQIPNSETTGIAMEWQESYQLNADNTFTKFRERNGITEEASGTFEFKDSLGEKLLVLTFSSNYSIIGSCTSIDKTEVLWVKSETKMSSTWMNCDGPGLEYERIE